MINKIPKSLTLAQISAKKLHSNVRKNLFPKPASFQELSIDDKYKANNYKIDDYDQYEQALPVEQDSNEFRDSKKCKNKEQSPIIPLMTPQILQLPPITSSNPLQLQIWNSDYEMTSTLSSMNDLVLEIDFELDSKQVSPEPPVLSTFIVSQPTIFKQIQLNNEICNQLCESINLMAIDQDLMTRSNKNVSSMPTFNFIEKKVEQKRKREMFDLRKFCEELFIRSQEEPKKHQQASPKDYNGQMDKENSYMDTSDASKMRLTPLKSSAKRPRTHRHDYLREALQRASSRKKRAK